MKQIRLTQGYVAVVDDEDFEVLSSMRWRAQKQKYSDIVYALTGYGPATVLMHRAILGLAKGSLLKADHRNGNGLDNRRQNLRSATHAQNMCNRKRPNHNTSGAKGVSQANGRYRAVIRHGGIKHDLGRFTTLDEAAAAYDRAAVSLHGAFARTNSQLGLS